MAPENIAQPEWITVDFRPAPAPVVVQDKAFKDRLLFWQCFYLTGGANTPYMARPLAGWLTQRKGEEFRVVAALCVSDGTVHPWDEVCPSDNIHAGRYAWCVAAPGDLPSKHSARQKWKEIQGAIIIEKNQE